MAVAIRATTGNEFNAGSGTITIPAGTLAGDVLLLFVTRSANEAAPTPPTGYTQLGTTAQGSSLSTYIFGRYAPGTFGSATSLGSFTYTSTVAGRNVWIHAAYSGCDQTTYLDVISTAGFATGSASTNHTTPSVSASNSGGFVAEYVANKAATIEANHVPPAGVTEDLEQKSSATSAPYTALGHATATSTSTGTDEGGHTWTSTQSSQYTVATVVLKAAAGASPGTVAYIIPGGHTATTAKVNGKLSGGTSVRLAYSVNSDMSSPSYMTAVTPDGSGRVKFTVTGLSANTQYYFQFADTPSGGSESLVGLIADLKTMQTAGTPVATRKIAFGACHETGSTAPAARDNARAWGPDWGAHLGDTFYNGGTSTTQSVHEGLYETQFANATNFKEFLAAGLMSYAIRSDHDTQNVDNGDSGGTREQADINAFKAIMPYGTLGDTGGTTSALDQQVDDGRWSHFFVDQRSMDRTSGSATDNSSKTMIGAAQKARLKDWLANNTAKVKFLWLDTGWMGANDIVTKPDAWWSYDTERQEILSAPRKGALVILHGDSHLVGYATPTKNTWGGVPVICAAGYDQLGGGRNTSTFTSYWNNSSTQTQQYGRLTLTDDGTTMTVVFSGWDGAADLERVAYTFAASTRSSRTGTLSFDARTRPAAKTGTLSYDARTRPTAKASTLSYDTRARTAQKDGTLSYDARTRPAAKTGTLSFDVRTRPTAKTATASYDVRLRNSTTGNLTYDVDVLGASRVQKNATLSYDVRTRSSKTGTLSFDVRTRTSAKTGTISYDIRTRGQRVGTLSFNLRERGSKDGTPSYDVRFRAAKDSTLSYDVMEAGAAAALGFFYSDGVTMHEITSIVQA